MSWRYILPCSEGQKQKRSIRIAALLFAAWISMGVGPHPAHGTPPEGPGPEDPHLTNSERTVLCPWLTDPKLAKDMLNRGKLWDSLYRTGIGNAIPPEWIFARAESDPDYRAALNKKIETDSGISPGLKRMMRLGKDHAEFLSKIKDPIRDLNPSKAIQQEWEVFRKSLIENKHRPMPPHEAENIVRNQMAQQLGIPVDRFDQHLKTHAQDHVQYKQTVWKLSQSETHHRVVPDEALRKAKDFILDQIQIEERKFTRIFTDLLQGMMAHEGESLWLSKDYSGKGAFDKTSIQIKKLKTVEWVTGTEADQVRKESDSWFPTIVAIQSKFDLSLAIRSREKAYELDSRVGGWLDESTMNEAGFTLGINTLYKPSLKDIMVYLRLHTEEDAPRIIPVDIDEILLLSRWADNRVNTLDPKQRAASQRAGTRLFALAESLRARDWLQNSFSINTYRAADHYLRSGLTQHTADVNAAKAMSLAVEVGTKAKTNRLDATDFLKLGGQLGDTRHWDQRTAKSDFGTSKKSRLANVGHFASRHVGLAALAVASSFLATVGGGIALYHNIFGSEKDPKAISQAYSPPTDIDPKNDTIQSPSARAWITETVWLPTAADSQAWKTTSPETFLAEYGDPKDASESRVELIDITERILNHKYESIPRLSQKRPKAISLQINSDEVIVPTDGWVSIPRPHNANEPVLIYGNTNPYERIVQDTKTGNVFLKFKNEVTKVSIPNMEWRVNYPLKMQREFDEKRILQDERLQNLNESKVLAVADEMDDAGLTALSQSISDWVQMSQDERTPLTVTAFVEVISSAPHYYSQAPGGSDFLSRFSFNDYRKFLRFQRGDSLLLKCDYANELLQISLKKIFEDHEDIKVLPSRSLVFNIQPNYDHTSDAETLTHGFGVTTSYAEGREGHRRTIIEIDGKPGAVWLDGTPRTLRRGEVLPDDSYFGATAPVKPTPKEYPKRRKTKPAKVRSYAYIREDRPLQTLEDHAPDLQGEAEEQIKSTSAPDLQVNMAEQRQLAAQKIRALADKIVELPSLQAISGLNPAPLPLATYRLALKLAGILEGSGNADEFIAALYEVYPYELENAPNAKTTTSVRKLWESAVAIEDRRIEKLRKISMKSRIARYDLAWTLDKTLLDFSNDLLKISLEAMGTLNAPRP